MPANWVRGAIGLDRIDRVLVMGGTGLLRGMQHALAADGALSTVFKPDVKAFGTVGSPQMYVERVCARNA